MMQVDEYRIAATQMQKQYSVGVVHSTTSLTFYQIVEKFNS